MCNYTSKFRTVLEIKALVKACLGIDVREHINEGAFGGLFLSSRKLR